jgi:hypothetical protein
MADGSFSVEIVVRSKSQASLEAAQGEVEDMVASLS